MGYGSVIIKDLSCGPSLEYLIGIEKKLRETELVNEIKSFLGIIKDYIVVLH